MIQQIVELAHDSGDTLTAILVAAEQSSFTWAFVAALALRRQQGEHQW
jgi:hypothetical protein